jgi:hypothetical protein
MAWFLVYLTGISDIHFTETLLQASALIITQFHLNFNNMPASLTCRAAKKTKKLSTYVKTPFFLPFGHNSTVVFHLGTRFSTVPHIIPASQVLSKKPTAGFGQGFPERASAAQLLPLSEISRNGHG